MQQPSRLHEEMNSNIDEWSGPTGGECSIERLCSISLRACFLMNPLISAIYQQLLDSLNQSNSISGVKKDNSAITIADGLVQKLLTDVLFSEVAFRDIVGEEGDDDNDVEQSWFEVQGLSVPPILRPLVETTKDVYKSLRRNIYLIMGIKTAATNISQYSLTLSMEPESFQLEWDIILLYVLDLQMNMAEQWAGLYFAH